MSTAGSVRSGEQSPFTARGADQPPVPPKSETPKRVRIFRWQGIFALIFGVLLLVVGWMLVGDFILRSTMREAATKALGAQVDIGKVHLGIFSPSLEIRDFAIAHPFDSTQNVLEIKRIQVILEGRALLEKKMVIRDILVDSMRGLTKRKTPAHRVAKGGFLPGAMTEAQKFANQFKVPVLSLLPIGEIKALVMDPSQLNTVKQAKVIAAHADSLKEIELARFKSLKLAESADSAQALLARLKGKDPRTLGLAGTRTAVNDVRKFVARVDSTRRTFDGMRVAIKSDMDSLAGSVKSLDDARQADYDYAKGLLKLPTFDAPNIGPALFGQVSIDAFERAMYWVTLAREYAPPGLLPKESEGPKRLRASGTTVHFVKAAGTPLFHLKHAALDLALDANAGAMRGAYALRVADVTSDPGLVGKPLVFSLTRSSTKSGLDSLLIVGSLDHTKARQTESIVLRAGGVSLPEFTLPGIPLRLDLGRGESGMRFDVVGDSVTGRWTVNAPRTAWLADSARKKPLNTLEDLVTRVLRGIPNVDVTADIRGPTKAPALAVRSNLDRAVADNIKRVAGEEISKAEAKVRAQVDAYVEKESAPVKAKIAETRTEVEAKVAEAQGKLDKAKADLAARLKELSGGLIGG